MGSKFFGIECKAGKNKPTALQEKNLREITMAGGIALVIDEKNVHQVTELVAGRFETQLNLDLGA